MGLIAVMTHIIKDSIHKDIKVTDAERAVIDSMPMQRLRRIRQLGMTSLVYPSATHTRFEHSLGAMHVAGNLCRSLGFSEEDTAYVRMAALLHDIGHFPFSHILDENSHLMGGKGHAKLGAEKITNSLAGILRKNGLDPKKVAKIATGEGRLGSLLSGGIDADKMDYLVRDAQFTGVAYGMVDLTRLYYTAKFNGSLAFDYKALRNIESVVVSRFMMFQSVYLHPTIRSADAMLVRAVENALEKNVFSVKDLAEMDDTDLISALRQNKEKTGSFIDALDSRNLYKIACEISGKDMNADFRKKIEKIAADPKKQRQVSGALAARIGFLGEQVLINIFSPKPLEEVKILQEDKSFNLSEISSFARSIMEQERESISVLVCVPEECMGKAKGAGNILIELI